MERSVAAVICAAGASRRMEGVKKEFLPLPGSGLTVLGSSLSTFALSPRIKYIVITVPHELEGETRDSLPADIIAEGRVLFAEGGDTRRASVHNALKRLEPYNPAFVLIHDGARPWVSPELIERVIDTAIKFGAVIPALPLLETPKELEDDMTGGEPAFIKRHLRRATLCGAQTPQGFKFAEILTAHEKAAGREKNEKIEYTDDAEVWGEFIGKVAVIKGSPQNKKITYPEDIQ